MVVIYYHDAIKSKVSAESMHKNSNWLINLFKLWPRKEQPKKIDKKASLA